MTRFVCIHGHFYQPPREHPALGLVERQRSAAPWHDWNERIVAECYAPNAFARVLDGEGRLVDLTSNYERISFDFGPTLLAWLERHEPALHAAIVEADRRSIDRFGGHGSAIAHPLHHPILPLATPRDRDTEIALGIADFRRRFGRAPEGFWLPETAVDLETLDALARHGIAFTVLAPHQALRVRQLGAQRWTEVDGGRIDPKRAYRVALRSGRSLAVFFYDGPVSRAIAFERLLDDGARLRDRLLAGFDARAPGPQLMHVATDGETYGHHHRFGEMALAHALAAIERSGDARLTNYGEFLELHPPRFEVEIAENTAWSCAHGLGRWWKDCGCRAGPGPTSQEWRRPLREGLEALRNALETLYVDHAAPRLRDPWAARDAALAVLGAGVASDAGALDAALDAHAVQPLDAPQRARLRSLMEMQRQSLAMFTSCGWFFDALDGIETRQVLLHADRALQLAEEGFGRSLEAALLEPLTPVAGDRLWREGVRPRRIDSAAVAAHAALASFCLLAHGGPRWRGFDVEVAAARVHAVDGARLGRGKVSVADWTGRRREFEWLLLHRVTHWVEGGVVEGTAGDLGAAERAFAEFDFEPAAHAVTSFPPALEWLGGLFADERERCLDALLEGVVKRIRRGVRALLAGNQDFLERLSSELPRPLELLRQVESSLAPAGADGDLGALAAAHRLLDRGIESGALATVEAARSAPFEALQTTIFRAALRWLPELRARAGAGDAEAVELATRFESLGRELRIRFDRLHRIEHAGRGA